MLLLPAVSQTFADSLVNTGASEHSDVTCAIADGLAKKSARGEFPSLVWLRIVRAELIWCANNSDKLTARHRQQARLLLNWYYSQVGCSPESWFAVLYPAREFYYRVAIAEIDWCARHVNQLNGRQRDDAIDLLEEFCAANPGEFRPAWKALYW